MARCHMVGCLLILFSMQCYGATFNVTDPSTADVCIMLDAEFSIQITYSKGEGSVESFFLNSNSTNITSAGLCGGTPTLYIRFPNRASWNLIFKNYDGVATLDLNVQFKPKQMFSDEPDNRVVTFDDPGTTPLSQVNESYACSDPTYTIYNPSSVPETDKYNLSVSVVIDRIQVQAFGIKNNDFSPPHLCAHDDTSTTPQTASTTGSTSTTRRTTLSPEAPFKTYIVRESGTNNTCIVLQGRLSFEITYPAKDSKGNNGTKMKTVVPIKKNHHRGNCDYSENEQSLTIHFLRHWSLDLIFTKTNADQSLKATENELSDQRDIEYNLSHINFTYITDSRRFPDTSLQLNKTFTVSKSNLDDMLQKSTYSDYYKCSAEDSIGLSSDVRLRTENFKFKAFNNDNSTDFRGSPSECSADDDDDNLTPIIIGIVFSAVALFVILIYIIIRYRNHRHQTYMKY